MLHVKDSLFQNSKFGAFTCLVFFFVILSCRGESLVIGSSNPIVAQVGEGIILPCRLDPALNALDMTLEWVRPDLDPRFVFVWRDGVELKSKKHPSYQGRTSLFPDELEKGNISLKLSKVKISDEGKYRCFIPGLKKESYVQLVVGAVSSPGVTLEGIDQATSGVVLQCESGGWYPEPEVLWLDGEGKLLSAGPPETVRGPDDLYTVSSRVTVEKRHSNSFTCRVQQKDINQTREAHIKVSDDFFNVQSSSSTTIGLAVSLAVSILLTLLLAFFVLKWRQNKIKTKRNKQSGSKKEREQLMTDESVQIEVLNEGKGQNQTKQLKKQESDQQHQDELQKKQEADNRVKALNEELKTNRTEVEKKQVELQQLEQDKQEKENEVQSLKEGLEDKKKELERLRSTKAPVVTPLSHTNKKEQLNKDLETLTHRLAIHEKELQMKTKEFTDKQSEILPMLQDENQKMGTELQTLMKELESGNMDEGSRPATAQTSSSGNKWPIVLRRKLEDEQQKREQAEKELKDKIPEFQQEKQEKEKAQREVKDLKNQLDSLNTMLEGNEDEIFRQLQQEIQKGKKAQRDLEYLRNQLELRKNELENQDEIIRKEIQKREGVQREKEYLEKQLESQKNELKEQKKEFEKKEATFQQEKIKQQQAETNVHVQQEIQKTEGAQGEVDDLGLELGSMKIS